MTRLKKYRSLRQRKSQHGGLACVPCAAMALTNPVGAGIAVAGACVYGGLKAYKCIKNKTKKKGKLKKGKLKKIKKKNKTKNKKKKKTKKKKSK
jgi:hypothetical protein